MAVLTSGIRMRVCAFSTCMTRKYANNDFCFDSHWQFVHHLERGLSVTVFHTLMLAFFLAYSIEYFGCMPIKCEVAAVPRARMRSLQLRYFYNAERTPSHSELG